MTTVRVALLGCGVVGSEVAAALAPGSASLRELEERVGVDLELVGIGVRDVDAPRPGAVDRALLTDDTSGLVSRADVVVELMGGMEPARSLILDALRQGASVVTANKALLAAQGPALHTAAAGSGVAVHYEAAVAGAVPIIAPLRVSLAGDRVTRVLGIVNGTTNYVLDAMDTSGAELADALASAQDLGYAEADPTADVDGYDAAAKAVLLARLAFHAAVPLDAVHREGIMGVTAADVASARQEGMVIKLLAIAERCPEAPGADGHEAGHGGHPEGLQVRVHPALVPRTHPLAGVREAFNAVFVEADAAGELMFYGRGAGGAPTSSAVLGDLVAAVRDHLDERPARSRAGGADLPVCAISAARTRYHVRLDVADRPGVLATVAEVFAEHGVSIETVRQHAKRDGEESPVSNEPAEGAVLAVTTHEAREGDLAATVARLAELDAVAAVASVLRVEGV